MSKVTVRTGGVVVGRRNQSFDLDVTTMILDLVRRGYRVYVRGEGDHLQHSVMLHMINDQLETEFVYGTTPITPELRRMWGEPDWWAELDSHLTALLPPSDHLDRITNYPFTNEESNAQHTEASAAH